LQALNNQTGNKLMSKPRIKKNEIALFQEVNLPSLSQVDALNNIEKMELADTSRRASVIAQAYTGKVLASLKESSDHGEYLALLASRHWHPRSAQYHVQFAELATSIVKVNPEALAHLDMSKWLLLQRELDQAQLESFIAGDKVFGLTLETAGNGGVRKLRSALEDYKKTADAALGQAQQKIDNLETDKKELTAKNFTLASNLKKLPKSAHFAEWAAAMRAEAALQSRICDEGLDVFAQQLDVLNGSYKAKGKKGHDDWRAATGSVLHQLGGIAAKAQMLYQQLAEDLPEEMKVFAPDFALQEDELDELQRRWDAVNGK
jgi:hypothetical protein